MMNQYTCDYCKQEMPFHKVYSCILEYTGDYKTTKFHGGHKSCMSGLLNAYRRTGKIMTKKEVEAESFDASI